MTTLARLTFIRYIHHIHRTTCTTGTGQIAYTAKLRKMSFAFWGNCNLIDNNKHVMQMIPLKNVIDTNDFFPEPVT